MSLLIFLVFVTQPGVKPWTEGVTPERKAKAEALLAEGNAHFLEANYREALTRYEDALTLYAHPAIHFNIARVQINLDQQIAAYES
ncbi:MAG: hypothetical protein AAFQ82_27430, partial [Myxococcota bacterium]